MHGILARLHAELNRCPRIWIAFALAGLTFLLFLPVRHHDFVNYDDPPYITQNTLVQAGLTWEGVRWAFTGPHAHLWHPLATLSHMLDCQLFGMDAGAHHLGSVLIHSVTAALLFLLLTRMTGLMWRSAVVAGLFAFHPLRIESVAWACERKDVLCALFWVLTIGAYVRYVRQPDWKRYGVLIGTFALGIMTKGMIVTLPLALLLLDYWPLGRGVRRGEGWADWDWGVWWKLVREKIPLLLLSAFLSVITFVVQKSGGAVADLERYSMGGRVGNALIAYVAYIGKLIWPTNLAVLYPHSGSWPISQVILAGMVLGAITFAAWRWERRAPWLPVGWFWYLGTLVPVIGLVQAGAQARADRFTYIPSLGLLVIAVWGLAELAKGRVKPRVVGIMVAVALLACAVGTRLHLRHWVDSERLFTHALAVTRDNAIAHNNLGAALAVQGRHDEAIGHYREALRLRPNYDDAYHNLARLGRLEEVLSQFRQTLAARPDNPRAHNSLAAALAEADRYEEAAAHYREALRLRPTFAAAHFSLANVLVNLDQLDEAAAHYREAVRLAPKDAEAHQRFGVLLVRQQRWPEARQHYARVLELRSKDPSAHYNLANVLMRLDRPEEAMRHYREALRLAPNDAEAHNNFGAALARQQRWEEALERYTRALELRPRYAEAHYNMAAALDRLDQPDQAIPHYQTALEIQPDLLKARQALGMALAGEAHFEAAAAQFELLVEANPQDRAAHFYLGLSRASLGEAKTAVVHLKRALELQPDWPAPMNALARLLASSSEAEVRDGHTALKLAQRALELGHGEDPMVWATVGAAYAELDRFDEAATATQKAGQLARAAGLNSLAEELERRLALFAQRQPYREKP